MQALLLVVVTVFLSTGFLSAQCNEDRHSTEGFDGWISCQTSNNPNAARGKTHWLRYNFNQNTALHDVRIWNINHPDYLDDGVKEVIIDYRTGTSGSWQNAGTFTIPRANGSSNYSGRFICDLKGINARQLLITPVSNYGGGCMGLSELKIYKGPYTGTAVTRNFIACESDGVYKNLKGEGAAVGKGVTDNGNGTFDFDAFEAGVGTHPIAFNGGQINGNITVLPCSDGRCGGCNECGNPLVVNVDDNPISSGSYYSHQLESKGRVNGSGDVFFWGGNNVTLNPGFEVRASGQLEAMIRPCYLNRLPNPSFEFDLDQWRFETNSDATATIAFLTNIDVMDGSKAARVNVTDAGNSDGDVRLRNRDNSIIQGKKYRISFAARSNIYGKTLDFEIRAEVNPYTRYIDKNIVLNTHWQNYSFEFVAPETIQSNVEVRLFVGNEIGQYFFDDFMWAEL